MVVQEQVAWFLRGNPVAGDPDFAGVPRDEPLDAGVVTEFAETAGLAGFVDDQKILESELAAQGAVCMAHRIHPCDIRGDVLGREDVHGVGGVDGQEGQACREWPWGGGGVSRGITWWADAHGNTMGYRFRSCQVHPRRSVIPALEQGFAQVDTVEVGVVHRASECRPGRERTGGGMRQETIVSVPAHFKRIK